MDIGCRSGKIIHKGGKNLIKRERKLWIINGKKMNGKKMSGKKMSGKKMKEKEEYRDF